MEESFLCIDTNTARLERLKILIKEFNHLLPISAATNLASGLQVLCKNARSVIFISHEFPELAVKDFISSVLKMESCKDTAFILIIEGTDEIEDQMAIGLIMGVNGFIVDPFSEDGLREAIEISKEVKVDRLETRQKNGIALCLKPAKDMIDEVATVKSIQPDFEGNKQGLKRLREAIMTCESENSELYFKVLIASFIRLCKTFKTAGYKSYGGASHRVKTKVAAKITEEQIAEQEEEFMKSE